MGVVVRRDNEHETMVKGNDDGGWSSNGVVLWIGRRQNGDAVEMVLQHFHWHCYKRRSLWFFVGEGLSRLGLAMDEHIEHRDLCDSGRRNITPYVHRRDGCCIVV
jgi:hypothetical protein